MVVEVVISMLRADSILPSRLFSRLEAQVPADFAKVGTYCLRSQSTGESDMYAKTCGGGQA